jgi:hypothetical protein
MAWHTGTIALAAHRPPNMPLLPELGWLLGDRLLQTCHSYGVALPRSHPTGSGEERNPVRKRLPLAGL